MPDWPLSIELGAGEGPAFLRISRAIADDIRRGRLRGGDALPGTRTLAASLGVHRNTVLAAYRELQAEGWIVGEHTRGTFVSRAMPDVAPRRFSSRAPEVRSLADRPGFDLGESGREPRLDVPVLTPSGAGVAPMSLGGGIPDVRLAPAGELARAVRRVLARKPVAALSYGDPQGPLALREALARMVSATRGVAATPADVLVTRGSQMAIDLVARALVRPGDVVAVEALGYRPAWEALRAAGARLAPIPVDAHGFDVEALERLCHAERVRAVYVTPHHQFPTTVTLAPARRLRLLELARERRILVLEDDYDHEFHYEGRPVLPLASADLHGVVVYVGTLSKVLAPGMRIGFLVAPAPLVRRLAAERRIIDRQGDQLLELAVADMLEDGAIQRHIRRARRVYAERRARLAALLTELGGVLSFALPNGGTAIWARVARPVSPDAWAERAAERGLVLQPAKQFAFDGRPRPFLRVGFAQHDEREAREAVGRMTAALAAISARSPAAGKRDRRRARSSP